MTRTYVMWAGVLAFGATVVLHAQTPRSAEEQMKAAQYTAQVDGDLKKAIEQYRRIAQSNDRAVASQALIRMAECYQQLGDAEGVKIYERIVREFADQKQAAAIASARLGRSAAGGMIAKKVWNADTYGSVSPDGRYLSFVGPATFSGITIENVAPLSLALHDLRNGSNREIEQMKAPLTEVGESAFSRDGKLIVYTVFNEKEARYQLRLANVDGDPHPRPLFDNPDVDWLAAYDWMPDNRSVIALLKRKDHTAQIGFISIPDGSLRILKSVDWRGTGRIYLTPDGKYLGYDLPVPDNSREHDVFVLNTDGSHETTAVAHPSLNFMMGWSPDGKRLLFASNRTGATSLWSVPFADGKTQGPPELIRADIGQGESMGMTRSGDFFYGVWSAPSTSGIGVASIDPGPGRVLSTARVPKEHSASDTQPRWSPDGNFLAYLSDRGVSGSTVEQIGQRSRVLVIRSSDTNQIVGEFDLNLSEGNGFLKGWTPDGRALLISGVDGKGRPGLFRVDARTGATSVVGFVELKPAQEWSDGVWRVSADAANLYVRRQEPGCREKCTTQLYRRNVRSGVETELVRGYQLGLVNLSPDDEYIAMPLTDPVTNSRTFAVIPTAGGPRRDLMSVPAGNRDIGSNTQARNFSFLAWSPDSRYVLIRQLLEGKPIAVWRAALDGAPPEKLDWAGDQFTGREVSISPDGGRIAYVAPSPQNRQPPSEIWMLENVLRSSKANRASAAK